MALNNDKTKFVVPRRTTNSAPAPAPIQTVGAPPERHADRVTAEMMRYLAAQSAHIRETVREIVRATLDDGGPRGQQRMCQRIEAAGTTLGRRRRANVRTILKPGKRGKYKILVMFWAGWDRDREQEIKVGDPIPERPQLVYWAGALEGTGNGRRTICYLPILIISHHVLSRTAQRHELRTVDDMLDSVEALNQWVLRFTDNRIRQVPPEGWRVPVNSRSWLLQEADAQLIVQRHWTLDVPIAVTILDKVQAPAATLEQARQDTGDDALARMMNDLCPSKIRSDGAAEVAAQGLTEADAWERIVAGLNGPEARKERRRLATELKTALTNGGVDRWLRENPDAGLTREAVEDYLAYLRGGGR
jgi:hypothetical protein